MRERGIMRTSSAADAAAAAAINMLTSLSLIGTADLVRTGVAEEEEQQAGSAAAAAALGAVGVSMLLEGVYLIREGVCLIHGKLSCPGPIPNGISLIASNLRVLFGVSSWQQSTEILAWDEGSRRW
ncbi:hypothetical protein OsJ_14111 [Oryza sativa Japonica Group]|uniref:OSJNBa0079F16.6 protein n=1 Tax=Oryza sativa subsp. japonica TaxID=39947 RepID=Q7XX01_ORYSJ|nr:hypothetical protein OsJ_14111 [Oryza sativa Japonica Group]CAD39829.3 OSJNBa0079F16.6 [Oryza sativa Japonica Group]